MVIREGDVVEYLIIGFEPLSNPVVQYPGKRYQPSASKQLRNSSVAPWLLAWRGGEAEAGAC